MYLYRYILCTCHKHFINYLIRFLIRTGCEGMAKERWRKVNGKRKVNLRRGTTFYCVNKQLIVNIYNFIEKGIS